MRFTKIIATVGPASDGKLKEMVENGMDAARINFSHASHKYADKVIDGLRELSDKVAIILDTKGPEIRIKVNEEKRVKAEETIVIGDDIKTDHDVMSYLNKGDKVLLDDGKIELKVLQKKGKRCKCNVMHGGLIKNNKSLIIVGKEIKISDISKKDKKDIKFGVKKDVDFIAVSFAKNKKMIEKVRNLIGDKEIKILAKIEHPKGVENIDEIIEASDGIMVARGDLGLNMPYEEVPIIQKRIIKKCNAAAKVVIVATQMLESMLNNPNPTRAETSDVANAIYDGADCVMLSGETAIGKYPLRSLEAMGKICEKVDEVSFPEYEQLSETDIIPDMIGRNVNDIVDDLRAKAVFVHTESGFTASLVSKYKPKVPIVAITDNDRVYRQLSIIRSVFQLLIKDKEKDKYFKKGIKLSLKNKWIKKEDLIVLTYNASKKEKTTNALEIREVKDLI